MLTSVAGCPPIIRFDKTNGGRCLSMKRHLQFEQKLAK
jgi:hypothetical protein